MYDRSLENETLGSLFLHLFFRSHANDNNFNGRLEYCQFDHADHNNIDFTEFLQQDGLALPARATTESRQ